MSVRPKLQLPDAPTGVGDDVFERATVEARAPLAAHDPRGYVDKEAAKIEAQRKRAQTME